MKRILLLIIALSLFSVPSYADSYVQDLPENTDPAETAVIHLVNDPTGTPVDQHITIANFKSTLGPLNFVATADGVDDNTPDAEGEMRYNSGVTGYGSNNVLQLYSNSALFRMIMATGDATNGQGMIWNTANGRWEVGNIAASITEASSDPAYSSMSTGDLIVSTSSGDIFYKSATGGYTGSWTYTLDPSIPTYSSGTILAVGNSISIAFSEAVTQGTGWTEDLFTLDGSVTGAGIGMDITAGDTTDAWTGITDEIFETGETITLDFAGAIDGVESATGGDLASISGAAVTNDSEQGSSASDYLLHQQDVIGNSIGVSDGVQSHCFSFNNDGLTRHVKTVRIWHVSNDMNVGESETLTVRIGTSNNLTTYLTDGEATLLVSETQADGVYIDIDFSALLPEIAPSTEFYVGVQWSGLAADQLFLGRSTTDVDVNTDYYSDTSAGTWNMTEGPSSARDFTMQVITFD